MYTKDKRKNIASKGEINKNYTIVQDTNFSYIQPVHFTKAVHWGRGRRRKNGVKINRGPANRINNHFFFPHSN